MLDDEVLPELSVQSKSSDDDCVIPHRLPFPVAPSNVHCQEKSLSIGSCVVVVVVVVVVVAGRTGADVVTACVCFRPEARDMSVTVAETTVNVIA